MPDPTALDSVVGLCLSVIALAGTLLGIWRKGLPWLRRRRAEKASLRELWFGRDAVPENKLTGQPAQPARPPLGQMVMDIHHELHPNGGSSMKDSLARVEQRQKDDYVRFAAIDARLERIEAVLVDELHTVNGAVANAAEAAATLLPVVHDAIKAQPPEE